MVRVRRRGRRDRVVDDDEVVVVVVRRTLGALGLEVERCGRRASGEDGDDTAWTMSGLKRTQRLAAVAHTKRTKETPA
jgi:hypothetical protein